MKNITLLASSFLFLSAHAFAQNDRSVLVRSFRSCAYETTKALLQGSGQGGVALYNNTMTWCMLNEGYSINKAISGCHSDSLPNGPAYNVGSFTLNCYKEEPF